MKDKDELERLTLIHSPRFRALLEASRAQIKRGEYLSHKAFWDEVDAEES